MTEYEPLEPAAPTASQVRSWLKDNGYAVGDRGRISVEHREAFEKAHNPELPAADQSRA